MDKNIADQLQKLGVFKSFKQYLRYLEMYTNMNTDAIRKLASDPVTANASEGAIIYIAIEGLKG